MASDRPIPRTPSVRRLSRRTVAFGLAGAGAWAAAPGARAHQQKTALTHVLFNPRTRNIEVAHRFFLHDAEHAVEVLLAPGADIIRLRRTQAEFAAYAAQRFDLYALDGALLPLTDLGFEAERAFFWVYAETPWPDNDLPGLAMRHDALRDVWPDQVNLVNVERADGVRSVEFAGRDTVLSVDFSDPARG